MGPQQAPGGADVAGIGGGAVLPLRLLAGMITGIYFFGGILTAMVDILVPKFKALFTLNYTEAMLTQFCYFLAYLVFSLPAGRIAARLGAVTGTALGVAIMALGCVLFAPAAWLGSYPAFLFALFVVSAGTNLFQISANPLIARLGGAGGAHGRLALGLAFNALGYAVGPLVGTALILSASAMALPDPAHAPPAVLAAYRLAEGQIIQRPFLGLALGLVVLAGAVLAVGARALRAGGAMLAPVAWRWGVWRNRRLVAGALAIFCYVGAEVSIGSLLISYLGLPRVLALPMGEAGHFVALYWLGAMAGRFVGSFTLGRVPAGRQLAGHGLAAIGLIGLSLASSGWLAAASLIGVGLANSIMFPALFTLSLEELGEEAPIGAALLCMAIVGGAILPLVTGGLADLVGLGWAPVVPALCYGAVVSFGLAARPAA
ncbi:MAG TPA: glucose/galactose MFS transporter [Novosphingobium sp.]|nr:glucose/galactose MFS transporter [Novosphingobium sp.]